MPETAVLLDTTIQIERHFYPVSQQRIVEEALGGCRVYMSSTTFREFQGSMLSAFDFVVTAIREVQPETPLEDVRLRLDEILRYVATAPLFSSRVATRVQLVVALIASSIGPADDVTAADVVDLLEGERTRLRDWRFFLVGYWPNDYDVRERDQYVDLCSCVVAREPRDPAAPASHRMSCNRERRACGVFDVLEQHLESVQLAASAVVPRKPLVRDTVAKAIEAASERRYPSLGERLCWPLGDTFIGLEALVVGSSLYSRDEDQRLIATALDIRQFDE